MKSFYLILSILFLTQLAIASDNIDTPYDFITAKDSLMKIAITGDYHKEKQAEALIELAEGYENYAEYYQMSKNFYKKVLKKNLPDDSVFKIKAGSGLERIQDLEKKYRDIDQYLFKRRVVSDKSRTNEEVLTNISEIDQTIQNNPNYYKINELKYFLAKDHAKVENYSKANDILFQILKNKPSISLKVPIGTIITDNYRKLIKHRINKFIRYSSLILLIISVVLFYVSKPWSWVSWKHILYYLAMVVLWYFVYKVSLLFLARDFNFSNEIIKSVGGESPAYISSEVNIYASQILGSFFNYVLILLTGVFLFSIAIYRNKFIKLSIISNILFTVLLSFTLFIIFYFRELNTHSKLYSETDNFVKYLSGHYFFRIPDMESYILVNPDRFTQLKGKGIKSKIFKNWVDKNIENPNYVKEKNE